MKEFYLFEDKAKKCQKFLICGQKCEISSEILYILINVIEERWFVSPCCIYCASFRKVILNWADISIAHLEQVQSHFQQSEHLEKEKFFVIKKNSAHEMRYIKCRKLSKLLVHTCLLKLQ